jgi:hypothetical protein
LNAANVVILNGIDAGGDHTFKNSEDKKSMIDYIAVSDNIILPTPDPNINSDTSQFLEHSFYDEKSFRVYFDHEYHIGDHFLITCQIKLNKNCTLDNHSAQQDAVEIGQNLNIVSWNRKDHGDPTFWQPMQYQLEKSLMEWDIYLAHSPMSSIDFFVQDLTLLSMMHYLK